MSRVAFEVHKFFLYKHRWLRPLCWLTHHHYGSYMNGFGCFRCSKFVRFEDVDFSLQPHIPSRMYYYHVDGPTGKVTYPSLFRKKALR